jgi:hypothetical protein
MKLITKLSYAIFLVSLAGACQPPKSTLTATVAFIDNGWSPPKESKVPASIVSATKSLLGNGIADPRGGDFHKVTVMLGNASGWMGQEPLKEKTSFGWIMPDKQVVLIDGLKYPIKRDLGPAKPTDLFNFKNGAGMAFSSDGIMIEHPTLAMTALLLSRGEKDLAGQCFEYVSKNAGDPALQLFAELTYRYYMQTAQCLLDHRDGEAKSWAENLVKVSNLREKAGLNFGKDTVGWRFDAEEPMQILRDVTRRAAHPKPALDLKAVAKFSQSDRIKSLIENLDEVAARQWGQPGGISWYQDSMITALTNEGQAAVPALLDCIENDDRMTRSVSFGRDFFPKRTIHSVRTAALQCLLAVWPSCSTIRAEDPKIRIAKLREAWKSSANLTEPERWLNVLRDDKGKESVSGTGEDWVHAAQHITDPLHVIRTGQGGMSVFPQKSKVMHGEPLRAGHGAEIIALLTKRVEDLTKIEGTQETFRAFEFANGLSIAHCLSLWDSKASIPVQQQATSRTLMMVKVWSKDDHEIQSNLIRPFSNVIADRSLAGDTTAANDFGEMLPRLNMSGFEVRDAFIPLWKCPNDAGIQREGAVALARMLSDISGPTKPGHFGGIYPIEELLRSPTIISPAFRKCLANAMSLTKVMGTVTVTSTPQPGSISYRMANGGGAVQPPKGMDLTGYTAKDMILTTGDLVSQTLAGIKGAPLFLVSWPADKKMTARVAIAKWLSDKNVDWVAVAKSNPFVNMDID